MRLGLTIALVVSVLSHTSAKPTSNRGIFKYTIAASDPLHTTLPWLLKYLPTFSSGNNCVNDTCACGVQGRAEVKGTTGFDPETTFGIHTVFAAGVNRTREFTSGPLSLAQVEKLWDKSIGDLRSPDVQYTSLLDHHVALWAASLDPFVEAFENGSVGFLRQSFTENGTTYFSIVAHCAHSQLVVELISNRVANPDAWPKPGTEVRHFFQGRAHPEVRGGMVYPLHVSRAVTDLHKTQAWYEEVFHVQPSVSKQFSDGTRVLVYGGDGKDTFSADVSMQFVQRSVQGVGGNGSSTFDAAEFEKYLLHMVGEYETGYKSCWPIWGDNHIALNFPERPTVADINARLDTINSTWYHPFRKEDAAANGLTIITDPSGWQVQVNGLWGPPEYLPDADVDDGGFGGYCYKFCASSPQNITFHAV